MTHATRERNESLKVSVLSMEGTRSPDCDENWRTYKVEGLRRLLQLHTTKA